MEQWWQVLCGMRVAGEGCRHAFRCSVWCSLQLGSDFAIQLLGRLSINLYQSQGQGRPGRVNFARKVNCAVPVYRCAATKPLSSWKIQSAVKGE